MHTLSRTASVLCAEHSLFIDEPSLSTSLMFMKWCVGAAPFLMTPYLHGARYLWKQNDAIANPLEGGDNRESIVRSQRGQDSNYSGAPALLASDTQLNK